MSKETCCDHRFQFLIEAPNVANAQDGSAVNSSSKTSSRQIYESHIQSAIYFFQHDA